MQWGRNPEVTSPAQLQRPRDTRKAQLPQSSNLQLQSIIYIVSKPLILQLRKDNTCDGCKGEYPQREGPLFLSLRSCKCVRCNAPTAWFMRWVPAVERLGLP